MSAPFAPARRAVAAARRTGLLLLPALLLAGCETVNTIIAGPGPPPPCPRVAKIEDASRLTRFQGTGRDLTDVAFEAEIGQIASACDYGSDSVDVALQIQFIASRGPADQQRRAPFTWFIAVARPDLTVPAGGRQAFDSVIEFPGNQVRAAIEEQPEVEIQLQEGEVGRRYVVYVGFELTPDELEFNRRHRP